MYTLPLESVPNQEFNVLLDDKRYTVTLKELGDDMCIVTIARDGVTLVSNVRAVAGYSIIRYAHLQMGAGNFAFITVNGEYPHWSKFNSTQQLVYASESEIQDAT